LAATDDRRLGPVDREPKLMEPEPEDPEPAPAPSERVEPERPEPERVEPEPESVEPEESAEAAELGDPPDEHPVPVLLVCAIALGLLLLIMGATIVFQHAGGFAEVDGLQCRGGNAVDVNEHLPTPLESPEATVPVAARAAGLPEHAGWARVHESADAVEFKLTKDGRPFASINTKHVTPADGYPSAGWTVTGLTRCAN
jgi:hypothetical protein